MPRKDLFPKPLPEIKTEPFERAEEAWFWFILAQAAQTEGARAIAGLGMIPRPCEPADILIVLNTLYRHRRLLMDHLMVLRYYGRRQSPPDPRHIKEVQAFHLWKEAMNRIEPILVRKGIVRPRPVHPDKPGKYWSHGAIVHNGTADPLPI